MISGQLNEVQYRQFQEKLKAHALEPKQRQRILYRMAKHGVIAATKRHVKQQQNIDGSKFSPRKTRKKGKMLQKLPSLLVVRELPEREAVRLYFHGGNHLNGLGGKPLKPGVIAAAQQMGMTTTIKKEYITNFRSKPGEKATVAQAKALRNLGFSVEKNGRRKKATLSYIKENLSKVRAGTCLRVMRDSISKSSWSIELPKRDFLGVSDQEFAAILIREFKNIHFGSRINAQDIKKRG